MSDRATIQRLVNSGLLRVGDTIASVDNRYSAKIDADYSLDVDLRPEASPSFWDLTKQYRAPENWKVLETAVDGSQDKRLDELLSLLGPPASRRFTRKFYELTDPLPEDVYQTMPPVYDDEDEPDTITIPELAIDQGGPPGQFCAHLANNKLKAGEMLYSIFGEETAIVRPDGLIQAQNKRHFIIGQPSLVTARMGYGGQDPEVFWSVQRKGGLVRIRDLQRMEFY